MKLDKSLVARIHNGLATPADFKDCDASEVAAAKADYTVTQRRFFVDKAFGVDESKRRILGVPHSTERTDRMGDIIRVAGWELEDFKANPNLFFSHNTRDLPIARALKVRKGRSESGMRALLMDEEYHEEELNPESELVWRMASKGALPGRSVGFIALESRHPETPEERESLKLGPWGVLYTKQELLESSIVPVPANADALQGKGFVARCYSEAAAIVAKAVEDGELSSSDAQRFIDSTPITGEDADRQERERKRSTVSFADVVANIDLADTETDNDLPSLAKQAEAARTEAEALRDENAQLRDQVSALTRAVEALSRGTEESRGARGGTDLEHRPNADKPDAAHLSDALFAAVGRHAAARRDMANSASRLRQSVLDAAARSSTGGKTARED